MKFKPLLLLFILFSLGTAHLQAQKRGAVWCFGDSALVDFSDTANIITGRSIVNSRGSCTSICDTSGKLLFYSAYDLEVFNGNIDPVKVYNSNHQIMMNGDSIKGGGWYHEILSLPFPGSDSLYYVFYIGVTFDYGFYYAIVDLSKNGGAGEVIQKNVQLQSFKTVDCLTAIKHGNGRDWWVLLRRFISLSSPNNEWYIYLISPAGVSSPIIQNVGATNSTNAGNVAFNSDGSKMMFSNYKGLLELYDFDRCTGLISNPQNIYTETFNGSWPAYWGGEFSPSGDLFYLTRIAQIPGDSSRLFQFDLNASNIANSKLTLWTTPWEITIDQLKRGPDNKIYLATNYTQVYPYNDTTYNNINMNISVINQPDSIGFACNLQPFSFGLGGARCYAGFPNNPDYDLTAIIGSTCDTLLSVAEPNSIVVPDLFVYYAPIWQTAFINAQKLKGREYTLEVYDLLGNEVFKEVGKLNPPYFNENLYCTSFSKGMYVVVLQTEKEHLTSKFIIQ